jgi:signal transduction histidine kinase
MAASDRIRTDRFVTPGMSLAVVTVTAAGLLKVMTGRGELHSGRELMAIGALGVVHALLGTIGLYAIERRGSRALLRAHFTIATAVASAAVVASGGSAFLLLASLISQSVLYLSGPGVVLVAGLSTAATLTPWALRAPTALDFLRDCAIWAASVAFVVVFSRALVMQHRARAETERLAKALHDANERLRAAAARSEELARAKERNRVAREIHDGLGHCLTALHVQLEAAQVLFETDQSKARSAMVKAQELTREGLAEVRRSVALLRTSAPRPKPLLDAVRDLARECTAEGIDAAVKLGGTPRPLADPIEFTLYRATQEALTNVRRHARASKLTIELTYASPGVRLRIEDDGVGTSELRQGFGLTGLRERAEIVGGTMSVHSTRGRGFTLEVELPG